MSPDPAAAELAGESEGAGLEEDDDEVGETVLDGAVTAGGDAVVGDADRLDGTEVAVPGFGAVVEVGASKGNLPSSGTCPTAAKGRSKVQTAKTAISAGLKLGDEQKIILPVRPPVLPKHRR